jgi:hypothetical protein
MEFDFLKTQTYLHEICQIFMIHPQFGGASFMGRVALKVKIVENFNTFSNEVKKFHKHGKVSTTDQNLS